MENWRRIFLIFVGVFLLIISQAWAFLTDLRVRGYSIIPAPQKVELAQGDIIVDSSWGFDYDAGVDRFTVQWLDQWLVELHSLRLSGRSRSKIVLRVVPGTVKETKDPALNEQAYLFKVFTERIEITGNSQAGLFYGVQSLLQLLRRKSNGKLTLPSLTIIDWPDLEMRFVHWDTKFHQSRPETLKREIDWLAFFKVNYLAFDLDDRYEYPSHPIVGMPGAYTKAEMQELTAYARERHIELVPDLQAPAHMAYALKHPEFASLREDGNNYQACLCNEEAIKLIQDLYQDLIEATPGVKYFHASMDEVYYAGICGKCRGPYNEISRSQTWVDYVLRMHRFLREQGRRMLVWVEYPLLAKDILQLPPDIINGVMGSNPEFLANQGKIGMRQLSYTPMQGEELLFPNYFPTVYRGQKIEGRLWEAERTVRDGLKMGANPIGCFAAAWDASGLHEETFWLGWITVIQYAWTCNTLSLEQSVADFMDFFYGPSSPDMVEIYRMLQEGARFFESGWDEVVSRERGPSYGNSKGKGIGTTRYDLTLDTPLLPSPGNLRIEPLFARKYQSLIGEASRMKKENDRLIGLLLHCIGQVERNKYNVEVLLSIAYLEGYFIRTVLDLDKAEESLLAAARADSSANPSAAVKHLIRAEREVSDLLSWGDWMWKEFKSTWEKSRYPKGRSVGGRDFVYILNDTKDLYADRRLGLEYQIAPFQRMELPAWRKGLVKTIKEYAAKHNVPIQGLAEERLED